MKKKIIAFYDVLIYAIIVTPLIIFATLFAFSGIIGDSKLIVKYWYLVILFAFSLMIPITGPLLFRYFVMEGNSVYFHYFTFIASWKKATNNIDIRWNQNLFISEVKDIELVKLNREEMKKVFYKHWFNRYLKVNLKYGNAKYVYVGNYGRFQIKRIIRILTNGK